MSYTLADAAKAANVTKPTLWRRIKKGAISATKAEDGTYRIDPAELHRYLSSVSSTKPEPLQRTNQEHAQQSVTAPDTAEMIALRAEVEKLKALLARADEDRDRWARQAERLALPAPAPAPAPLFRWWRRAG